MVEAAPAKAAHRAGQSRALSCWRWASRWRAGFSNISITDELRSVTRSVADLGVVPMPVIQDMIEEFAGQFAHGAGLMISAGDAEQLLSGILSPEEISDIMSDVTGNSNQSIWQRLSGVSENLFAGYLVKEHPQAVAVILSKVTPVCAAKVMGAVSARAAQRVDAAHGRHRAGDGAGDAHHREHPAGRSACQRLAQQPRRA